MLGVPSYYGLIALSIVFTMSIGEIAIVCILWLENRKEKKRLEKKKLERRRI